MILAYWLLQSCSPRLLRALKKDFSLLKAKKISKKDWQRSTLGEVVTTPGGLQTGPFGNQLSASDYEASGVPVLMPRDLAGNRVDSSRAARVSQDKAAELERFRLNQDDIIIARRGRIGRCALVPREADGWICGTGCLRVRLSQKVVPDFFYQFLQWPKTVAWLQENAVGQTMGNLNTRIFSNLPLSLPPIEEQQGIAAVLRAVDDCLNATHHVIDQTATVKDGLLRRLLSLAVGPRASSGESGNLTNGWRLLPIGELCHFRNGHGFKATDWASEGLPIIRIKNLNGSKEFKFFAGAPKDNWIVEPGELLFAWAGVKGVSFGPRIWEGPRGLLNQHIYRVRPRQGVAKEWLFEVLRQITHSIEERAQGFKSSLVHIRRADVEEYQVPVPPYDEQRTIAKRSAFFKEMQRVERESFEGQIKLKRALMNDLFEGRVTTNIADLARA